jgi:hypothetical protein
MATNKEILDADVKNAEYILKLEALCENLADILKELADIVDHASSSSALIDTFTTQPAKVVLADYHKLFPAKKEVSNG